MGNDNATEQRMSYVLRTWLPAAQWRCSAIHMLWTEAT